MSWWWDGMGWCDDEMGWCDVMWWDLVGWDNVMMSCYVMEWGGMRWCDAMMWWDDGIGWDWIRYVTYQYDIMSAWCDRSSPLMLHITSFHLPYHDDWHNWFIYHVSLISHRTIPRSHHADFIYLYPVVMIYYILTSSQTIHCWYLVVLVSHKPCSDIISYLYLPWWCIIQI